MNFIKYLNESTKVYNYRIKVAHLLDNDMAAQIEHYFTRFRLLDISEIKKTIMQKNPMDFSDLECAEIYMLDIQTGLPCSSYILQQDIRNILNIPEKFIVVRGENEPIELEGQQKVQDEEIAQLAKKDGLVKSSLLSVDSNYQEAEQTSSGDNYYGNSYNNRLLDYMKSIEAEHQPIKVNAPDPLFSWLKTKEEKEADFNASLKQQEVSPLSNDAKRPAPTGNFDNEHEVVRRTYINKNNKPVIRTAKSKPTPIRKD